MGWGPHFFKFHLLPRQLLQDSESSLSGLLSLFHLWKVASSPFPVSHCLLRRRTTIIASQISSPSTLTSKSEGARTASGSSPVSLPSTWRSSSLSSIPSASSDPAFSSSSLHTMVNSTLLHCGSSSNETYRVSYSELKPVYDGLRKCSSPCDLLAFSLTHETFLGGHELQWLYSPNWWEPLLSCLHGPESPRVLCVQCANTQRRWGAGGSSLTLQGRTRRMSTSPWKTSSSQIKGLGQTTETRSTGMQYWGTGLHRTRGYSAEDVGGIHCWRACKRSKKGGKPNPQIYCTTLSDVWKGPMLMSLMTGLSTSL